MRDLNDTRNRRILIIDDNEAIHADFRKILAGDVNRRVVDDSYAAFFGEESVAAIDLAFEIDSAFQGQEGLEKVRQSSESGRPYAMAFLDVRMPPGWDGIETVGHLWKVDPHLLVVICTAYSDYNWSEMAQQLDCVDRWQILKKPFDNIEVRQLAASLTEKWDLARKADLKLDELQQMVEQRTRETQKVQQQLLASQKLEAVGTLAGGVAHEFNNLLQVIRGYTSFAMEGLSPDETRYLDLGQVLAASDRAATLTSHLLAFSRRSPVPATDVKLNEVIGGLLKIITPLMTEKIELKMDLGDTVGTVKADSAMMQQMILNLCTNARDAMPAGGLLTIQTGQVTISDDYRQLHPDAEPGEYALLSISDTGCGMRPDVKDYVFEPFFTTKEVGKGTGLGLSMVYGVVQQLKGMIDVESEVGQGTTFTLYLPIVDQLQDSDIVESHSDVRTGTETILIAEDEELVRDIAVRVLKPAGYTLLVAAGGDEAVRLFKENADSVDLLLLDVVMPKMSGRDAYEQIKTINSEIRTIFCTGYDPNTGHAGYLSSEGLRVIQKPFSPHELLRTVRETLDAKPACQVLQNVS